MKILIGTIVPRRNASHGRGATGCRGSPRCRRSPCARIAAGSAMAGMRPIHVHIRMGFPLLCMNNAKGAGISHRGITGGCFPRQDMIGNYDYETFSDMTKAARKNNRVILRLVRRTYPGTMLVQVARTCRAMTLRGWCANRFVRFRASPDASAAHDFDFFAGYRPPDRTPRIERLRGILDKLV
jgi:hypothetical protein